MQANKLHMYNNHTWNLVNWKGSRWWKNIVGWHNTAYKTLWHFVRCLLGVAQNCTMSWKWHWPWWGRTTGHDEVWCWSPSTDASWCRYAASSGSISAEGSATRGAVPSVASNQNDLSGNCFFFFSFTVEDKLNIEVDVLTFPPGLD